MTEAAASTNRNTANTFSVHSLALHLQTAALAGHMYHKQLTNCSFLSFLGREQAHLAPKNPPNLTAKEDPTEQNREKEPAGRKREIWRTGRGARGSEEAPECRLENISHHQLFIHQHNLRGFVAGGRDGRASHPPVVACADVLASAA